MNNIRLLNQNDLDSYIELMKFGHHNYEWDRYYLENVSIDRLKTILSNHTDYWNIFGAFEDDELVEITPQSVRIRKADLVKLR